VRRPPGESTVLREGFDTMAKLTIAQPRGGVEVKTSVKAGVSAQKKNIE
jgi:hypothetical protein